MAEETPSAPVMHIVYSNGDDYVGECKHYSASNTYVKHGKGVFKATTRMQPVKKLVQSAKLAAAGLVKAAEKHQDVYDGGWENDLREGQGRMQYANGDAYEGDWKYDVQHGKGI